MNYTKKIILLSVIAIVIIVFFNYNLPPSHKEGLEMSSTLMTYRNNTPWFNNYANKIALEIQVLNDLNNLTRFSTYLSDLKTSYNTDKKIAEILVNPNNDQTIDSNINALYEYFIGFVAHKITTLGSGIVTYATTIVNLQ